MNTLNIQFSFCNARIKQSPQYSLEVQSFFSNYNLHEWYYCKSPITPPPQGGALFIPNTFEGSLFERGGLFNLAKAMASVLYKIKKKQKARIQSGKA